MIDAMTIEWEAWQVVCKEMRRQGIEPNDCNRSLIAAIRVWGERVAQLRSIQPAGIADLQLCRDLTTLDESRAASV